MGCEAPQLSDIKQMMKAMWMAGDFGKAELMTAHGEEFVARLNLKPGTRVLDVGWHGQPEHSRCANGNCNC
jgi:hypothetical protein